MQQVFDDALTSAVRFLQGVSRERDAASASRSRFESFRAAHPGVEAHLAIDRPPGSPRVDYDILIRHPAGGTAAAPGAAAPPL